MTPHQVLVKKVKAEARLIAAGQAIKQAEEWEKTARLAQTLDGRFYGRLLGKNLREVARDLTVNATRRLRNCARVEGGAN